MPASTGELTTAQSEVLAFIRDTLRLRGYPPTLREVARDRGVSTGAAVELLAALERKRRLRRVPYVVRSLIVLEPD